MHTPTSDRFVDALHFPTVEGHFCQVHQDEAALVQAVVTFLAAGVANGENIILVTRKTRQTQILDWLKAKLPASTRLVEGKNLFLHSSNLLLDHILVDGMPDWRRFEETVTRVADEASVHGQRPVRLYGDAVSELWQGERHAAAVEVERHWNRLLARYPDTRVFCGYLIDALDPRSYSSYLQGLGQEHNMVLPGKDQLNLVTCLQQASREILGHEEAESGARRTSESGWRARLPLPMQMVLWILDNAEELAEDILQRARTLHGTGLRSWT